eukprot:1162020-Pelagomonas_calceolata.AAC.13
MHAGMNEKVGLLSYRMDRDQFDKPYSNETAQMIDHEVRTFVDTAYKRTVAIVEEKKELVQAMAKELLDKEVGMASNFAPRRLTCHLEAMSNRRALRK